MVAGEVTEDVVKLLGRPVASRQVRLPMLAWALRALVAVRPKHVPDGFPHIQFEMIRRDMNLDRSRWSKQFEVTDIIYPDSKLKPEFSRTVRTFDCSL